MPTENFSPSELRELRKLSTPWKIQCYLDKLPYHLADTAFSPRNVLRHRTAHCLEGAIFAAAALRVNGYAPLIFDLEAVNDTDHVLAVYREAGGWGAIGSSNYPNCRFRAPIHRTLRELAISYFNDYFNDQRQRTLRTFSRAVNLKRFDRRNWMTAAEDVWFIPEYLLEIPHTSLLTPRMTKALQKVDERSYRAGTFGRRLK